MDANFNPVNIKPDLKKAVNGFGSFKVALATVLTVKLVLELATFFEYPPVVIEELSNATASAGLIMIRYMEEKGQIEPTSIRTLLCALKKMGLFGIEMRVRKLYEEHTGRLCSSDDQSKAQLEEEQLVTSSASSSTAKSPPSQKGDRTEEQLVTRTASSSTAKSAPSHKVDRTEEQLVTSSASSVPAKSPPSQKGDRTEKQSVASSASSSPAKSPPSQNGDGTEKQSVASSASSSPAKSPPSQNGDGTDVKNKLFISFSSKTKKEVTKLARRIDSLVGKGSCWMYLNKNLPGDSVAQNISDAIENAVIVLCIINQDYLDSVPCEEEFLLAKESGKQIILLHMEKISRPYKTTNRGNSRMQLGSTDKVYARMYENFEEEFQKVIAKIKECLFGRNANAYGSPSTSGSRKRKSSNDGGSPSTSGSRKRKSSNDGDASVVKVTKKE